MPAQMAAPTISATAHPCEPKTPREATNPSKNATPTVMISPMSNLRRMVMSIVRTERNGRTRI